MRLIKTGSTFLIALLLLIMVALSGTWYYATSYTAKELNLKYAGKKFAVTGIDKKEYFVTFEEIVPAGFPYKFAWDIKGWAEESRSAKISYTSPIQFGYDLLLQQAFINYDGEIISAYKPAQLNFGSRLKIKGYKIAINLPINGGLIDTIKKQGDSAQLINHFDQIKLSTGQVEVFDLLDNEKFYDKEYEFLNIVFVPRKNYTSIEDFLDNIPTQYTIDYTTKTKPMDAAERRLPVSLFYAFSATPAAGFDMTAHATIQTSGRNISEIKKGLAIKSEIKSSSSFIDISNFKIDYKASDDPSGIDYALETSSKFHIKEGLFDEIFKKIYSKLVHNGQERSVLFSAIIPEVAEEILDRTVAEFINSNKQKLQKLENSRYDFNLKMNASHNQKANYIKIDDFSIFSDHSGFRLNHQMEATYSYRKDTKATASGVILLKNYPAIVEFTSGYVFDFKKLKLQALPKEAEELYIEVNKAFLKDISEYPDSTSNDLSFEYSIDLSNLNNTKFGSVQIEQIPSLYKLMLYRKLFDKVGHGGDVLARIQKILPDIKADDPLLEKFYPKYLAAKYFR